MPKDDEFGRLLNKGLRAVAAHDDLSMGGLRIELGRELSVTPSAIEKWEQGQIPRDPTCVSYLAEECVKRGRCDIGWLKSFLSRGLHPDQDRIINRLFPRGEATRLTIRANLTRPAYSEFVGRVDKLDELKHYLSPRHRLGVVCISGQGGVGKTALAQAIAHYYHDNYPSLSYDNRFDVIVYVSAKKYELLPSGTERKIPSFTDLDGVFRELSTVLDEPALVAVSSIEEKQMIARGLLKQHRTLLILDNMEDVDDPFLLTFLRELPVPSKALVTSRHRIDVAVPVHLTGLEYSEAKELVTTTAAEWELSLSDEEAHAIVKGTGGMPLAIVRTLARIRWRRSKVVTELAYLNDPNNDYYDFVYGRSLKEIRGKVAHKLFLCLSLFPSGATRQALGYVAGVPGDEYLRDQELEILDILSLVEKTEDRFNLNDLTRQYAANELSAHKELKSTLYDNWVQWYEKWCQTTDPRNYRAQEPEIPNIIALMATLEESGDMEKLIWFFRRNQDVLNVYGYWDDRIAFVEYITEWAVVNEQWEYIVEFFPTYVTTFLLHSWKGLISQASDWIRKGRVWVDMIDSQDLAQKLTAHIRYSEMLILIARLANEPLLISTVDRAPLIERARAKADAVYPVYRDHDLPVFMMSTLYEIGSLLRDEEMYAEATDYYTLASRLLNEVPEDQINKDKWQAVIALGESLIAARQGDYEKACSTIKENLPQLVHRKDLAVAHISLAYYETKLGNYESAKAHHATARRIRMRNKLQSPICLEEEWWLDGRG